jgi:predicted PurR-regulated permease PerM
MNNRQILFKYTILTAVYVAFLLLFWPFTTSLMLAALFAMAMTPLLNRWLKKTDKEKLLIFSMVAGLILIIIVPLTLIITKGVLNLSQLQPDTIAETPIYKNISDTIDKGWHYFSDISERFNIDFRENVDPKTLLPKVMQVVIPWVTAFVTNFPEFLLQLFVFVTSLYFFLWKRREFLEWFKNRRLLPHHSLDQLIALLQKVCNTVVFSTLVVACVQSAVIVLGASIAGFGNLMVIFIITFFMSFLPVVGTVPVAVALAAYSLLQGEVGDGIIMLVALGIAGSIDNVIRAYIMTAEEESMHPLVSLLTLIGALAIFGIPGLFLGPIIAELAFAIGGIMNGTSLTETVEVAQAEAVESTPPSSP